MNEFIEVRFSKRGKRLRVKRQVPGGIEFDESDPIERTVGIGFDARSDATRERMNSIRRVHGWDPGQFKLNVSVEDGSVILRGVDEHALPEGLYKVQVEIEEITTLGGFRPATVDHDSGVTVDVAIEMDDRTVAVDLADCDTDIQNVLDRSRVDGLSAMAWVVDDDRRPSRRACLLNVLVLDPDKPFFAEGKPHAPIHGRLLSAIPESIEARSRFRDLLSFRGEGRPSMQVVMAVPPADSPHTYADFDLDLGNPLQDLLGFVVHIGELLDGKPTNHLDLRKSLARRAAEFLPYKVVAA
jgi:hypothetical protein